MPDRHKIKPISLRLPEAFSARLAKYAAETGKPVRGLILEAIEAHLTVLETRREMGELDEYTASPENSSKETFDG